MKIKKGCGVLMTAALMTASAVMLACTGVVAAAIEWFMGPDGH